MRITIFSAACFVFWFSFVSGARGDCTFARGDANLDATVNIADALRILGVLFIGDLKPDCEDVMDANDVGAIDISDPVYLLGFLFNGSAAPPSPFRECGPDGTEDALSCNLYHSCAGCVSPANVAAVIGGLAGSGTCVPAGTPPFDVGGVATVTVLPVNRAQPCGNPPSPGWPIQLTVAQGTLDLPGRKVRLHMEGTITDMPVVVKPSILPATTCDVDISFAGDGVVGLELVQSGTNLVVTSLTSLAIENPAVDLTATGGLACALGDVAVQLIEAMLIDQIEAALADQLPRVSEELGCLVICPES